FIFSQRSLHACLNASSSPYFLIENEVPRATPGSGFHETAYTSCLTPRRSRLNVREIPTTPVALFLFERMSRRRGAASGRAATSSSSRSRYATAFENASSFPPCRRSENSLE